MYLYVGRVLPEVKNASWEGRGLVRHRFFFFQAEDGIRDLTVTGVQTCALPIFPEPIEIEPRDYDGNYGLGACYLHQAKGETAIDWFRKAAAAEPDSAAVRLALGITYMRTGKLPEAVAELKAAAALEPESRQANVLMGQAYNKLNQPREARQSDGAGPGKRSRNGTRGSGED